MLALGMTTHQRGLKLFVGTTKVEKMLLRLNAYIKAFNKVDDLMEYRGMTKEEFDEIASDLLKKLKEIESKP